MALTRAQQWQLLPRDLLEVQLGEVDLLLAMYPEEARVDSTSEEFLESLREWCDGNQEDALKPLPQSAHLRLSLSATHEAEKDMFFDLDIHIPFGFEGSLPLEAPPRPKVTLRQPTWMSKAEAAVVVSVIPLDEDVPAIVERFKESIASRGNHRMAGDTESLASEPLSRVWFYFPSISTRSKRDDLIDNAPSYCLTGFLMAGKPGLLCLEGGSAAIDQYMRFIKTESWGDIPAAHKKVTERWREANISQRGFTKMTEVTDLIGERRGEGANRSDMKALETWLGERGFSDAFSKVFV